MTKRFAIIEHNAISNIAIADAAMGGNWIDISDSFPTPGIGWTYDGGVFTAPPVPEAPPTPPESRKITKLAFLDRFTDAEAIAIDLASIGATTQAAAMRRFQKKVDAATFIDLDRSDTRGGVQTLEAAGLLAVGRAAEILDGPIADQERYRGSE